MCRRKIVVVINAIGLDKILVFLLRVVDIVNLGTKGMESGCVGPGMSTDVQLNRKGY